MAGDFEVWGSDGHSIYNNKTKELINRTKNPVIIGDHCWFGLKCTILKNSLIPNNTVIGTSSVVSGNYTEENTIIAGIPARVVKKNINWNDISPIAYNKNIL